jgi:hypothetical protein
MLTADDVAEVGNVVDIGQHAGDEYVAAAGNRQLRRRGGGRHGGAEVLGLGRGFADVGLCGGGGPWRAEMEEESGACGSKTLGPHARHTGNGLPSRSSPVGHLSPVEY